MERFTVVPDPNADLIGYRFLVEGGDAVVTGTDPNVQNYVQIIVTKPRGDVEYSVRVAEQLRRRKVLEEAGH